ncbi:MAG: SGNH/GDSL hydrolase family protein [Lachnospiraceae bacterium]|nr:SGNH/GDSL hydrolase family protein [Lachnospiraceae bacterium]
MKNKFVIIGCFMLAMLVLTGCSGKKPDNNSVSDEELNAHDTEIVSPTLLPGQKIDPETGEIVANVPDELLTPTPEATPTPQATPTPEATPTPQATPTMSPAEKYQEGVEKSLVSTGNNYRLKRVLEKARNGEDVYICALGGSVTEGALAKTNDEGYAYQFADEFKATYCPGDGANLHFVNAGLSGTPSCLGIIRYKQDVVELLGSDPDILIIEFAINDWNEPTHGKAYESLIRKALEANEDCAVILLYSLSRGGWNMQDNYIKIGKYYSLQQVSIKNGIYAPKNEMRLAESLYFADDYHPTTYGHRFMKDCLMNMFRTVDAEEEGPQIRVPEKDFSGSEFKDLIMLDSRDTGLDRLYLKPGSFSDTDDAVVTMYFTKAKAFPNNFYHKAGSENKPLELKVNCRNILINYKTANNKEFGKADFYIDGEKVATADGFSSGGWNNCNVIMVLHEDEAKEHTLTVKMADDSTDKAFTIFSIGYSE